MRAATAAVSTAAAVRTLSCCACDCACDSPDDGRSAFGAIVPANCEAGDGSEAAAGDWAETGADAEAKAGAEPAAVARGGGVMSSVDTGA